MYRKGKSNDIKDIIDSSDACADYSYTNKYYDDVYDNKRSYKNDYTTTMHASTNNNFRQSNNTNLNVGMGNGSNTPANSNNIFLKASSQTNLFSSGNSFTKNELSKEPVLSLDADNFPSLGSASTKKSNDSSNVSKTLDFKKVVQTKPVVVQQVTTNIAHVNKPSHNLNKFYQEIKYKSEKYAKVKMYDEYSSDNDDSY